jgi:hypothetical protein
MSEQQQQFINELCTKFDEKYHRLVVLFVSIGVVFVSAALIVGATQIAKTAAMEKQIETNTALLKMVSSDYLPMWFMEGIQKNSDYKTEEIVATLQGDKSKVRDINAKYQDFQKTMINDLIRIRGGVTNITRSIHNEQTKGSSK